MANLKAPCEWREFGQVFKWAICKNGLLPNSPKRADSEKNFGQNYFKINLRRGHFHKKMATESQSHRVTDTQGYSVYGWVKFFCA